MANSASAASWVYVPSMSLDVYDVQSGNVVGKAGADSYCTALGGRVPTQAESVSFNAHDTDVFGTSPAIFTAKHRRHNGFNGSC